MWCNKNKRYHISIACTWAIWCTIWCKLEYVRYDANQSILHYILVPAGAHTYIYTYSRCYARKKLRIACDVYCTHTRLWLIRRHIKRNNVVLLYYLLDYYTCTYVYTRSSARTIMHDVCSISRYVRTYSIYIYLYYIYILHIACMHAICMCAVCRRSVA